MLNSFFDMLQYDFMRRALFAGIIISACTALLGVSLVLRKKSMIGDGLSHVAFGATAIAVSLGLAPLQIAIPAAIAASFCILKLSNNHKINSDAFIAITSASALAIGTIAVSINNGTNIDLNSYLFGDILAIGQTELYICIIIGIVTLAFTILFYRHIFALTIDESFAKAIGIKTSLYNTIIAILCSVLIVIGMRLLGALLISSLIVFPCLIAMQNAKSFRSTIVNAFVISIACFVLGLAIGYAFELPTSASIVLVNLAALLLAKLFSLLR